MLILPALVGVEYETIGIVELAKGLVKHVINLFKIRACGDIMGYYLTVKHIKYG